VISSEAGVTSVYEVIRRGGASITNSIPKGAPVMHGIDHSITFTRILALDLGKFNSVACIYERATHEHRFVSVQTTPQRMVMQHRRAAATSTKLNSQPHNRR
jgi:hypothetical protein